MSCENQEKDPSRTPIWRNWPHAATLRNSGGRQHGWSDRVIVLWRSRILSGVGLEQDAGLECRPGTVSGPQVRLPLGERRKTPFENCSAALSPYRTEPCDPAIARRPPLSVSRSCRSRRPPLFQLQLSVLERTVTRSSHPAHLRSIEFLRHAWESPFSGFLGLPCQFLGSASPKAATAFWTG
jgi:hypothetical protein